MAVTRHCVHQEKAFPCLICFTPLACLDQAYNYTMCKRHCIHFYMYTWFSIVANMVEG